MVKTASKICFKATFFRPTNTKSDLILLTLPKTVSTKLPSRGMTSIEGTINNFPFQATLDPDGKGSHVLKLNEKILKGVHAHWSTNWRPYEELSTEVQELDRIQARKVLAKYEKVIKQHKKASSN